jgi:hypothetical protein
MGSVFFFSVGVVNRALFFFATDFLVPLSDFGMTVSSFVLEFRFPYDAMVNAAGGAGARLFFVRPPFMGGTLTAGTE